MFSNFCGKSKMFALLNCTDSALYSNVFICYHVYAYIQWKPQHHSPHCTSFQCQHMKKYVKMYQNTLLLVNQSCTIAHLRIMLLSQKFPPKTSWYKIASKLMKDAKKHIHGNQSLWFLCIFILWHIHKHVHVRMPQPRPSNYLHNGPFAIFPLPYF